MQSVQFTVYRKLGDRVTYLRLNNDDPTWVSNSWMASTTPFRREAEKWAQDYTATVERLEV